LLIKLFFFMMRDFEGLLADALDDVSVACWWRRFNMADIRIQSSIIGLDLKKENRMLMLEYIQDT
jgi:hypothetical protein